MPRTHWSRCLPRPTNSGLVRHAPGYTIAPEWFTRAIPDFDLWAIYSGTAEWKVDDKPWEPLHRGSCLWLRPGHQIAFRVTGNQWLEMGYTHFDLEPPGGGRALPPGQVISEPLRTDTADPHLFEFGIRRLFYLERREAETPKQRRLLEEQSSQLLRVLLSEYALQAAQPAEPPPSGLAAHHLQVASAAKTWIGQHPDWEGSVADLARRFGYQTRYFCRIFRQKTGTTPLRAMLLARMDHARRLLATSSMNVGEIAESLGYRSIEYFSRQFAKEIGQPPSLYRQSLQTPGKKSVKKCK